MPDQAIRYELYYWPTIQGRGEFVRLVFEEAGVPYIDVARLPADQGGGVRALMKVMKDGKLPHLPLAPPFLRVGELTIAQTTTICRFLGERFGLVPESAADRLWADQLQLTIADLVVETHDAHHPLGSALYYHEQKPEARRRAALFTAQRLPKFLGYFEAVLDRDTQARGQFLVGANLSYVDLAMFQLLSGLRYAFPNAMQRVTAGTPKLVALEQRVAERPNIRAYLASPRRLPFNEDGIFRHYAELDEAGGAI